MRKIVTLIVCITCLFLLSSCGKNEEVSLKPGIYTLQNVERDVPGDFTITIYDDGTFQCYETPISSYLGMGHYSIDEGILTLKEDMDGCTGAVNYYQISDDALLFVRDDSANYQFVLLEDGAQFTWSSEVP